jgi:hypothetical protein
MTDTMRVKAVITCSHIMALMYHLDRLDAHKLSVIRFRQLIMDKLRHEPLELREVSNRAWLKGTEGLSDNGLVYSISTVIETLFYNELEAMYEYLGNQSEMLLYRMMMKLPTLSSAAKNSYELADILKQATGKEVYEYIKNSKQK